MSTLAECRQQTRSHLDEQTEKFWDDTSEIDIWIYEAAKDIARRAEVLSDTHVIRTKADQRTYDFPPDLLRVHKVVYENDDGTAYTLEFVPIAQMDDYHGGVRYNGTGRPSHWSSWGFSGDSQQFVLDRAPSEHANLVLYYYRLPRKPVADSDPVEVPAGWETLIPLYAEHVARRKDNDGRWQEAYTLYREQLEEMKRVTRNHSDQATVFSPGGTWLDDEGWWG